MSDNAAESSQPLDLDAVLARIDEYLRYLSGGVSFCEDRGYGWTIESEGWRREFIASWFDRMPELRSLCPTLWVRLQAGETIADYLPGTKEFDAVFACRRAQ